MTHASRGPAPWSSKLGTDFVVRHPRQALAHPDDLYGAIVVHFRPHQHAHALASDKGKSTAGVPSKDTRGPAYSSEEIDNASQKISATVQEQKTKFPLLDTAFEKNWSAWAASWSKKGRKRSSRSSAFAVGPEWDALVTMGPNILPQVVNKLRDRKNVFGCQLCEFNDQSITFDYPKLTPNPRQQTPGRPQEKGEPQGSFAVLHPLQPIQGHHQTVRRGFYRRVQQARCRLDRRKEGG